MSQQLLIRQHLADLAVAHQLDRFITVPFLFVIEDNGRRYRANQKDIPRFFGLMEAFSNALANKGVKRPRRKREPSEWLPIIAVPEYRSRKGCKIHPHWHGAYRSPEGKAEELEAFSLDFWRKQGIANCGEPIVPHIEPVYDVAGAMNYSSKWLDEQSSLGYTIVRGI